jgi:TMEM175 potassium channel family protein
MSISFAALLWWAIRHEHMKIALTPAGARRAVIRFGAGNAAYPAAIGIAFASTPVSLLVGGLVAVYYAFEQTPARASAPADGSSVLGQ